MNAIALIRGAVVPALLAVALPAQEPESLFKPFDRAAFEKHVKKHGATEAQITAFRAELEETHPGSAADDLMRSLFNEYDKAVGLAEDGEPQAALALTKVLAGTTDPYLRPHCRYHLGRVFLDADDPEQAIEIFGSYLREDRNRTPLDAEVTYFYGHALADIPSPNLAIRTLKTFLEHFPNAPERYLASATQQLAELERQRDNPLHEVADVMKGVERRIRKTNTGKETQERQKEIVSKLQQILEELEEEEQQSGAPGGLGNPTAPAGNSAAPPGKTRFGNIKKVPGIADRWGQMKDRAREEIESDLQTKLPGHYRRMLEEYYRKLGAGGR